MIRFAGVAGLTAFSMAVLAMAATPADAGSAKRHAAQGCRHISVGDQGCPRYQRRSGYNAYNSTNVYSYDGRLIGRDPDPNIRRSLRDEDAFYRWR